MFSQMTGAIIYTGLFIATLNFLVLHLREGGDFLTLAKMALSAMAIFTLSTLFALLESNHIIREGVSASSSVYDHVIACSPPI